MIIMECYFRCRPVDEVGVAVRGYGQQMYKEWQDRCIITSTEQRIADQAIRKNGWLKGIELEGITRKALNEDIQDRQANIERGRQITRDKNKLYAHVVKKIMKNLLNVNGNGTDSESPSSGRCFVEQQHRLGRHIVTADKSRRRWSKEINTIIIECYF